MKNGNKINVLNILIFMVFVFSLRAQENNYILWKISKEQSTVYLAPTIHILPNDFYPMNPNVEKIFEESEHLVVEVDIRNPRVINTIKTEGLKFMLNKNGENLKRLIPLKEYDEIKEEMKIIGLDLDRLSMLNPGTLGQLVIQVVLMQEGFAVSGGLDSYFIDKSYEMKKDIIQLEDPLFQLGKLFSLEFPLQLEELKESLSEEGKKETVDTIKDFTLYVKKGDLEGFEKNFSEKISKNKELKDYFERLLDERNIGMANKIDGFLKTKGTYFVAVGAGHFVGKNSIREILSKKGYKIERVSF